MFEIESSNPATVLHVVICTYNRSELLRLALDALSAQTTIGDGRWAVLVVDNNCTDDTQDVVNGFKSHIPGLEIVVEPKQGLTQARRRGFLGTTAPWVAFVDDDCIVASDWVEHALEFVLRRPEASGFNGRNTLDFETGEALPWITPQMFAAKDPGGDEERPHPGNLHGAGLVLRRDAVEASGWLENATAADRTGQSLVSGGDSELSVRVRSAGGPAWFVPQCRLTHRVDEMRLKFWYLMRLNFRLAESGPLTVAMGSENTAAWHQYHRKMLSQGWDRHAARLFRLKPALRTKGPIAGSVTAESGYRGKILAACRGIGVVVGYIKLSVNRRRLSAAIGLASVRSPLA